MSPARRLLLAPLLMLLGAEAPPGGAQPAGAPPIERMLSALAAAPDEQTAAVLEAHIETAWTSRIPPSAALLLGRARRELQGGSNEEALDDYSLAVDLDPDNPEIYRRRAEARMQVGDLDGAVRDIEEVVRREPRHYAAFADLSRVAEQRGDWRGAYAAWQRVMALDPKTPGGAERLRDLRRRALGDKV